MWFIFQVIMITPFVMAQQLWLAVIVFFALEFLGSWIDKQKAALSAKAKEQDE